MPETYDVIVIGGGHNGLVAGAYLAKAGQSVLVLEKNANFGGGVHTAEVTLPGFKSDMHSMGHLGIYANPLIKNDELQLQSKYGLKYIRPLADFSTTFPDQSTIINYKDLDRTVESIAQISRHDADAYYRLAQKSQELLPLIVEPLFVPPPPFGAFMAMMDQSTIGRNFIQTMHRSVLDILDEWFNDEKVKCHFMRLCSEHFIDPMGKGDGAWIFTLPSFSHNYGLNAPEGGSGMLVTSLVRCLEDHGAELRSNTLVTKVINEGGKASGVILEDGTEIRARNCIVGQIHPYNLPGMVDGLDEQICYEAKRVQTSSYSCIAAQYALDAPIEYAHEDLHQCLLNGYAPETIAEFRKLFATLHDGEMSKQEILSVLTVSDFDPTRAPKGKAVMTSWRLAPFHLSGGRDWDGYKAEAEAETLDMVKSLIPSMKGKVLAQHFETPLDFQRYTPSFQNGDVSGISTQMFQSLGHRPTPSLAQYAVPGAENLYLAGNFMHPVAGGVTGGGRATAIKIFNDKGWDFDKVLG